MVMWDHVAGGTVGQTDLVMKNLGGEGGGRL